jgi:hypothetical protein
MQAVVLVLSLGLPLAAAGWESVQRTAPNHALEVLTQEGARVRASFISATADSIVIRDSSGERSIERSSVREVRVHDPSRRTKMGILGTAIGAGAGFALGYLVCAHCVNENATYKYVGIGVAVGGGLGALGFLSAPYRTIYKSK